MKALVRWWLALGAVVVAAWFGLGWVQARDTGRAQTLLGASRLSPEQTRQVRSLLPTAGALNPDRLIDILRAQLASAQGQHRRAVSILESVTRAEPWNVDAWNQLVNAAAGAGETALAERAFVHLHALFGHPK